MDEDMDTTKEKFCEKIFEKLKRVESNPVLHDQIVSELREYLRNLQRTKEPDNYETSPSYEQRNGDPDELSFKSEREAISTESNETVNQEKPRSMIANPDDIVAFNNEQNNSHKSIVRKNQSEKQEVLNYENANKVMKKKPSEKHTKKRSSNSLKSDGPKPAEKLPKLQMGKNTSFSSEKKK